MEKVIGAVKEEELLNHLKSNNVDNIPLEDNKKYLLICAKKRFLECIKYLLPLTINKLNNKYSSLSSNPLSLKLLYFAVKGSYLGLIDYLFQHKIRITHKKNNQKTILNPSISSANIKTLKYLLFDKEVIKLQNVVCNAFFYSISINQMASIEFFLNEAKIDINISDKSNYNALHIASMFNNIEIARYLINKGIKTNTKTTKGFPFQVAVYHKQFDIANYYIDEMIYKVNNNNHSTDISLILAQFEFDSTFSHLFYLQSFCKYKLKLQERNQIDQVDIINSEKIQNKEYLEKMVKERINNDNEEKRVSNFTISFIEKNGINPTLLQFTGGNNALHFSIYCKRVSLAKYLIENYPFILQDKNKAKNNVLNIAIKKRLDYEFLKYLVDLRAPLNDGKENALLVSIKKRLVQFSIYLITAEYDYWREGELIIAAEKSIEFSLLEVFRESVSRGNIITYLSWKSPLMKAIQYDRLDFAQYLIEELKVDVNYDNNSVSNILPILIERNHFELAKYLIRFKGLKYFTTPHVTPILKLPSYWPTNPLPIVSPFPLSIPLPSSSLSLPPFEQEIWDKIVQQSLNRGKGTFEERDKEGLDFVKFLIEEAKADKNDPGLLLLAAADRCLSLLKYLLEREDIVQIYSRNVLEDLFTAAISSWNENDWSIVNYLFGRREFDLLNIHEIGNRLLNTAVKCNHSELLRYLINEKKMIPTTDLLFAAVKNGLFTEAREWIKKFDLSAHSVVDSTNLLFTCTYYFFVHPFGTSKEKKKLMEEEEKFFYYLVEEEGLDINACDHKGENILKNVCANVRRVKYLINRGIDLKRAGNAVYNALQQKYYDAVLLLFKSGAPAYVELTERILVGNLSNKSFRALINWMKVHCWSSAIVGAKEIQSVQNYNPELHRILVITAKEFISSSSLPWKKGFVEMINYDSVQVLVDPKTYKRFTLK